MTNTQAQFASRMPEGRKPPAPRRGVGSNTETVLTSLFNDRLSWSACPRPKCDLKMALFG